MNILVLPRSDSFASYGEIRDNLDQNFSKWLIINKLTPIIFSNEMVQHKKIGSLIKDLNIKGVILTGGKLKFNSKRFLFQVKVLNIAKKKKLPVLGICQGMQMLSVYYRGKLKKIRNHVKKNHKLTNCEGYNFPKKIMCFHDYKISKLPKEFIITSKSEDGTIESIKHKNFNWHGWMWHPERDKVFKKRNNLNLRNIFNAK